MNNVLFWPEKTEYINKKVSKEIASHLFLFCNYQPDEIQVFGHDAKFLLGVMNLYKLIVDASIILMLPQIARTNKVQYNKEKLDSYIKNISVLRTVLCHNVSVENGESDLQAQYKLWLKKTIGKIELQEEKDYEKAVKTLETMGDDICKYLCDFINKAKFCPRKINVITSWEEAIFSFYKKKSGIKIFLGQMKDVYLSRCSMGSNHFQIHRLKQKVAHWFQCYYCQKGEVQIENLQKILDIHGKKLSKDVCSSIEKELIMEKGKLEAIKKEIALKLGLVSPERLTFYHYQEYYCMELDLKLRNTLIVMKKSGEANMLPESLMQELIENEFVDIHSEDF